MEQNNDNSVREMLKQMSTEQLDEMLNKELHSEPIQEELIRTIMEILREREKDVRVEITPQMQAAWEKYLEQNAALDRELAREKRLRSWGLRIASIAGILAVLLVAVVPGHAEAGSLWNRLSRWTEGIVEFLGEEDNEHRLEDYEFTTENPGLQEVYDAAVEMGVTGPAVPMWLPEENELQECKVSELQSKERLYARFSDGSSEIVMWLDKYNMEVSNKYQKDDTPVKQYELHDTVFQIMRNNDMWTVVWTKDNIECSISTDCQEDTLYRILRSVYVMEV